MGRANLPSRLSAIFIGAALAGPVSFAGSDDAQPAVRVAHMGWEKGDKKGRIDLFRVSLENPNDKPTWFIFQDHGDYSLPNVGTFKSHEGEAELPFETERFDSDSGTAVIVSWFGENGGFQAFRLPPEGRLEFTGLLMFGQKEFNELTVLTTHELLVNGKTPLESWLPYSTTSSRRVVAKRDDGFTNLDWNLERKDYPNEEVKFVKAVRFTKRTVKFRPQGRARRRPGKRF
jgi:hypothetical protein